MNRRSLLKSFAALGALAFVPISAIGLPNPLTRKLKLPAPFSRWEDIEFELPKGVYFYDCAGQIWFPKYDIHGGLTVRINCILLRERDDLRKAEGCNLGNEGLHEVNGVHWCTLEFTRLAEITHDTHPGIEYVKRKVESAARKLAAA